VSHRLFVHLHKYRAVFGTLNNGLHALVFVAAQRPAFASRFARFRAGFLAPRRWLHVLGLAVSGGLAAGQVHALWHPATAAGELEAMSVGGGVVAGLYYGVVFQLQAWVRRVLLYSYKTS
jgi:hypothetical protein